MSSVHPTIDEVIVHDDLVGQIRRRLAWLRAHTPVDGLALEPLLDAAQSILALHDTERPEPYCMTCEQPAPCITLRALHADLIHARPVVGTVSAGIHPLQALAKVPITDIAVSQARRR
jgi:hypothetical protein